MVNGPLRWVFCLTGETVCEGDGGKKRSWVGSLLPNKIEGGSMVYAGSNKGKAKGDVDPLIQTKIFDRN